MASKENLFLQLVGHGQAAELKFEPKFMPQTLLFFWSVNWNQTFAAKIVANEKAISKSHVETCIDWAA